MASTLTGDGEVRQKWDVIGRRWMGGSEWSGRPISFFMKENWICAMTRHQAESKINILLTKNLPIDSGVRQWNNPLMIPLHCLWDKSNNRTRRQFDFDVTWICFCFNFVCSYARCGFCSIVFCFIYFILICFSHSFVKNPFTI